MMIRGVGDPLVAMYLRTYLARKGREIAPQLTEHLTTSFNDYIYTHKVITQRCCSPAMYFKSWANDTRCRGGGGGGGADQTSRKCSTQTSLR